MESKLINQSNTEEQLNSNDFNERLETISILQKNGNFQSAEQQNVNLHLHSFYSYNAEFWSPSKIAWESKKNSLYAAGIIDFDVLTGLEEFFEAGEILGLRTSVGLETRVFVNEFADKEIDSPGEPGVSYVAGAGFYQIPEAGTAQANTLKMLGKTAQLRNLALIERINQKVPEIAINFNEVLPLTPAGNATERHIVSAYIAKAKYVFPKKNELINFWADILVKSPDSVLELIESNSKFEDVVRSKFAKKGGLGYQQPSSETFPPINEFFSFVKSCNAIPMESWLDGTSTGEKDGKVLLELSKSKGAVALNIIPDRNWNISNSEEKALKIQNLKDIVESSIALDMPLHIGTEMNKKGLPFVDDLDRSELKQFKKYFLEGAQVIVGHCIMGRFADFAYTSINAENEFYNLKDRNNFYASIGALPGVNKSIANQLRSMGPQKAFSIIVNSAKNEKWLIQ